MADPRGFLKHGRQFADRRPVEERVQDWQEVYPGTPGRALLPIIGTQAGRCMDCGIPFCHQGCPLGNLIPEWNDLVWRDDWTEASERLHATNNFPEFTGRLCPAPCETACVLGINQDPVTIKNVEVAIADRAWDDNLVGPQAPEWLSGKTVAVVGSGPAGLAAAQQLHARGTRSRCSSVPTSPADCCATGSPSSRCRRPSSIAGWPAWRSRARSSATASTSGPRSPVTQLVDRFDAVVLAVGATAAPDLPCRGASSMASTRDGVPPAGQPGRAPGVGSEPDRGHRQGRRDHRWR